MFHTQEKWERRLSLPILCTRKDAWLGNAYYFWHEEVDSIHWGNSSKRSRGVFEIYVAQIDCENVLDTVFNEEHYNFWRKQIEKAAKHISIKTGKIATLQEINKYFLEKAVWSESIPGIMYQDLPYSSDLLVKDLNYRKRIQIAVFDLKIINTFAHHLDMECN